jgi:hypothetical protein
MAQPLYVGAALGCCVLPFLILLWNSLRASPAGVTAAAVLIVVGTFLDRIRVFVPAWAVAGPVSDHLEGLPALPIPTLADLLLVVGGPALAIFLVALAARVVRPVSTWEEREADVLRVQQPHLRTRVSVIGRPTWPPPRSTPTCSASCCVPRAGSGSRWASSSRWSVSASSPRR